MVTQPFCSGQLRTDRAVNPQITSSILHCWTLLWHATPFECRRASKQPWIAILIISVDGQVPKNFGKTALLWFICSWCQDHLARRVTHTSLMEEPTRPTRITGCCVQFKRPGTKTEKIHPLYIFIPYILKTRPNLHRDGQNAQNASPVGKFFSSLLQGVSTPSPQPKVHFLGNTAKKSRFHAKCATCLLHDSTLKPLVHVHLPLHLDEVPFPCSRPLVRDLFFSLKRSPSIHPVA